MCNRLKRYQHRQIQKPNCWLPSFSYCRSCTVSVCRVWFIFLLLLFHMFVVGCSPLLLLLHHHHIFVLSISILHFTYSLLFAITVCLLLLFYHSMFYRNVMGEIYSRILCNYFTSMPNYTH